MLKKVLVCINESHVACEEFNVKVQKLFNLELIQCNQKRITKHHK